MINLNLGSKAFKPKRALNAAYFDSIMVAVAKRLEKGDINNRKDFQYAYRQLIENPDYISATETATTDEENVRKRLELAIQAFEYIP